MTTYYESAEEITITRKRAEREVLNHGAEPVDFYAELGTRESYDAQEVLRWLGY